MLRGRKGLIFVRRVYDYSYTGQGLRGEDIRRSQRSEMGVICHARLPAFYTGSREGSIQRS